MVGQTLDRAARPRGCCRRRHRAGPGARPRQREGGGAALRPLPRGRHPARARDALDRRGDGRRHHVRPGLRQEPDGGGHPPARLGHGLPVAGRPGQAGRPRGGPVLQRARLLHRRHPGHGRLPALRRAWPSTRWWPRWGRRAWPPTPWSSSPRARCSWWSTPRGASGPRADGQHIRIGRRRLPRALPHHAGRGPGRRRRASPTARPTRSRCGRSRTCIRPPGADRGERQPRRRRSLTAGDAGRFRGAAQPGHDGVGHVGPRDRAGRLRAAARAGRGGGQVALGRSLAGQPGAAGARGRAGHAQQRRAAGPGARRLARRRAAGAGAGGRPGGGQHLGPLGRGLRPGRRCVARAAASADGPASWRSRST